MGWFSFPPYATDPSPSRNANEKQHLFLNPHIALKLKYKKVAGKTGLRASETDSIVCLTSLEDGEDVQQLPRCRHTYPSPCIEMWLYSHSECPLCRVSVDRHLTAHPCQGRIPEKSYRITESQDRCFSSIVEPSSTCATLPLAAGAATVADGALISCKREKGNFNIVKYLRISVMRKLHTNSKCHEYS
ncbi:Zinc finger, RING-type [Dillenia turbinata]|uniref:Zinc finger, RING-type n=1 Tax=Dillenia turbinata TaxID=194707 RepID=A0AAN8UDB3_9MAGN